MKSRGPIIHICGPEAEGSVQIGSRTYRWDFHSYLGPLFLKKDGDPLKRQPGEHHPVWPHFEKWLEDYRKRKPKRKCC